MTQTFDPVLTLVVCALMAIAAAVLLRLARVPLGWTPIIALGRAALQLALLTLVLSFILTGLPWVFAWLVVMLTVAGLTSSRRVGWERPVIVAIGTGIGIGTATALAIAFGTGVLELGTQYLLAYGGIIIGNSMSIASLSAIRLREQLREHADEVEGWLALGATPRTAAARFRSAAARLALIPNLDQTATTGLVVLPGAFVGAVFAGASVVDAGLFQLVVLAGISVSGAITAVIVTELLGAPTQIARPTTSRDKEG